MKTIDKILETNNITISELNQLEKE